MRDPIGDSSLLVEVTEVVVVIGAELGMPDVTMLVKVLLIDLVLLASIVVSELREVEDIDQIPSVDVPSKS